MKSFLSPGRGKEASFLFFLSPTFLAPGTGFMEDSFSTDRGAGAGSGGNAGDGERWGAMESGR